MAKVTIGGRTYEVEVRGSTVLVDGHEYPVKVKDDGEHLTVTAGGVPYRVQLPPPGERQSGMTAVVDYREHTVSFEGRLGGSPATRIASPRPAQASAPRAAVKGGVAAQIAGRIIAVKVTTGQRVLRGDVLLLLEAMKMENEIKAPSDGTVKELLVREGARVTEGETLLVIE